MADTPSATGDSLGVLVSKAEDGDCGSRERKLSRKRDLALAFAMIFLPMVAIPLILLAFVLYTRKNPIFAKAGTSPELPAYAPNASYHYYTVIPVGAFSLVGSWASNVAQFVVTPLMFVFSFLVAKAYCDHGDDISMEQLREQSEDNRQHLDEVARAIAHGAWKDVWEGYKVLTIGRKQFSKSYALRIATLGGVISAIFILLLIVGDNVLHTRISSYTGKLFTNIWTPSGASPLDYFTMGSFKSTSPCQSDLTAPLSRNGTSGTVPCSLNSTNTAIWTPANEVQVYSTLDEGIASQSTGFILSQQDYLLYLEEIDEGGATDIQIVTYLDPSTNLSHAFLFNMTAATSFSNFTNGTDPEDDTSVAFWGLDFTASTVSMVTNCSSATQACNIHSNANASAEDLAIPFRCSPIFTGDIWQPPLDGPEQFKGWHTWFFDNDTGIPAATSLSSQLNPFYLTATTALTSIDFTRLEAVGDPQVSDGEVVNAGNGRVALALTCTATVYNVDYSLIDGSIAYFNATVADPRLASIVKAPLQYGLGRYSLYQQAQIAILLNDVTVAEAMSVSFSQIGMALASGAFETTFAKRQRERWYALITVVPGYALWFIVVVCLLYAVFGAGVVSAAFVLRRKREYAVRQAGLVLTTQLPFLETTRDLVVGAFKKGKELDEEIEGDGK